MTHLDTDELLGRPLLGRYRAVLPIGRGGMGTVHLARTEGAAGFAKPVVLKCIHPELVGDASSVALFVREAKLLSNLAHPGIVNVLDFGKEHGVYVMVLEYVHGYDLGAWHAYVTSSRGPIPFDLAVYITAKVLEPLHYAHTYERSDGTPMRIVHRDVSPGNILIDVDGRVKLADFGIARAADDAGEYLSRAGTFKGKIAYAPPELVGGDPATPSSDVYSAGVVLLSLLVGRNPFKGKSMAETVQRVVELSPPRVSRIRRDVPPECDQVLMRALAKVPSDRFDSAAEFGAALKGLLARSEADVEAELTRNVRRDFTSDMPAALSLAPLEVRDAAWRGATSDGALLKSTPPPFLPSGASQGTSDVPTLYHATTEELSRSTSVHRARWPWLLGLFTLAGVGILGTLAAFYWRGDPGTAKFVVIDRQQYDPVGAATKDVLELRDGPGPKGSGSAIPSAAQSEEDALTRALRARQQEFQACFEAHVERLAGSPEVSVHFKVDASGQVTWAEVAPATLAKTPLGKCLVDVAKKTSFPKPGRNLSFHVPITARVSL